MLRMDEALRRLCLAPIARLDYGRGLAIAFLIAAGVFSPAVARADTPLVSGDTLTGAPCTACSVGVTRSVEGGSLTPGGWSQDVVDSRIMYDLGHGVGCGKVTFEATGWDPNQNMVGLTNEDNYHEVFGVYEGSHGDPGTAVDNGETHIDIQVVAAPDRNCSSDYHCRAIKLNGYAVTLSWNVSGGCPECRDSGTEWCQTCGGYGYARADGTDWDTAKFYSFELDWNYEGSSLTVSEMNPNPVIRETSVDWLDSNPMRYFFLGGDRKHAGKDITGPIYKNVQIWEVSQCANPCEGHCSNGVQDCVEDEIDKGGKCAQDAGADAGTQDTGVADTGVPDAGHDTGTVRPDTGTPADSGVFDAGKSFDTGTATDTGNGHTPPEETVGCSCATLSF